MADLSGDSIAPRGIDLVAGTAGSFTRGGTTSPQAASMSATGAIGPSGIDCSGHGTARLDLVITAAPTTVTVTVQTSMDNGVTDAWRTVAAFPAQTAVGTVRQVFSGLDRYVRASVSAITGTAGFTLSGELV